MNPTEIWKAMIEAGYKLEDLRLRYLTSNGWSHEALMKSTWRWQKKLPDGRVVLTDMHDALQIQQQLDLQAAKSS